MGAADKIVPDPKVALWVAIVCLIVSFFIPGLGQIIASFASHDVGVHWPTFSVGALIIILGLVVRTAKRVHRLNIRTFWHDV